VTTACLISLSHRLLVGELAVAKLLVVVLLIAVLLLAAVLLVLVALSDRHRLHVRVLRSGGGAATEATATTSGRHHVGVVAVVAVVVARVGAEAGIVQGSLIEGLAVLDSAISALNVLAVVGGLEASVVTLHVVLAHLVA